MSATIPEPTSDMHERLVKCDVSDLHPPAYDALGFIPLVGATDAQVSFAKKTRGDKYQEWKADLPENILLALKGIADATWWLANKDNDSANIGWPLSWTNGLRNRASSEDSQPSLNLTESREKVVNGFRDTAPAPQTPRRTEALNDFDAFAKKVCNSPELSYLAIMALMYRNGKDPAILEKFTQARERIQGHLYAIDNIIGRKS